MGETGFGFLRLPRINPEDARSVDMDFVCSLADRYIQLGGNYFDTAYTYLEGASEAAIREAVVRRHPRAAIRIADKLPTWLVKKKEDCERFFIEQLERCGVDYFDVYLMHGLDAENYETCISFGGFDFLRELKRRGRARSIGFSFHDSPELLECILRQQPDVDYVQLQINYLDWESETIQARRCYEIARSFGKSIIVMEPVKGGNLAALPSAAEAELKKMQPERSAASWAMRFARSLEDVEIVLSGMNSMEQIEDNMQPMKPLDANERQALFRAAEIIRSETAVGCTGCAYCVPGCPQQVPIPRYFSIYNEYARLPKEKWKMEYLYLDLAKRLAPASACIGCGACESSCPQKINIIESLEKVSEVFEGKKGSPIK